MKTHALCTTSLCVMALASWVVVYSAAAQAQSASTVLSATAVGIPEGDWASLPGEQPVSVMMNLAGPLVHADAARTKYPTINGAGYTVAILDTGVDKTHPALAGRYMGGYDFVNNDSNPDDDNGHGTHVCGIAASNDATYTGIAPQAGYAAVKVMNSSGSGSWSTIESGLQWVIANRQAENIVAVNMSFGTSEIYNSHVTDIISDELATLKNAGVFIAVSSGNGWKSHTPNQGVAYPAADPSAVSVGAIWSGNFGGIQWSTGAIDYTTAADRVVSITDRSTTMLDILAPGAIITSANSNWEGGNADFVPMGGTSMAVPAVAGLAVLIHEAIDEKWSPALRPTGAGWQNTILQIMQDHGVAVYDGDDEDDNVANLNYTFKRIDVLGALDYVASVPEPGTLVMLLGFAVMSLVWYARRLTSLARNGG